jgi:AmmeMemoRadiSam system protein B
MNDHSTNGKKIRPSTIEGIFYPDERDALSARLYELLNHTDSSETEPPAENVYGIIVPHAAYDYSGEIAAAAFKTISNREIETVVLLGPVHREPVEAIILPQSQIFQTPLGSVTVDEQAVRKLAGLSSSFRVDDIPHLEEHCLEAQLPFIQHLLPDALIVPILLGKPTRALVELLTNSLLELYSGRINSTLFVVTANMTGNIGKEKGRKELDQVLSWIDSLDWKSLSEAAERKHISSCGAGCVAAILLMHRKLKGAITALKQGSSLQIVKDPKKVVYYAAFVLTVDGVQVDGV